MYCIPLKGMKHCSTDFAFGGLVVPLGHWLQSIPYPYSPWVQWLMSGKHSPTPATLVCPAGHCSQLLRTPLSPAAHVFPTLVIWRVSRTSAPSLRAQSTTSWLLSFRDSIRVVWGGSEVVLYLVMLPWLSQSSVSRSLGHPSTTHANFLSSSSV